mgnify:FL=1
MVTGPGSETEDLEPRVAILLQVSPVRADRQLSRLHTIDSGYASWTHKKQERGSTSKNRLNEPRVTVFAAVHNTTSLRSSSSQAQSAVAFQNIRLVQTFGDNPFHKLLDAFVGVMSEDTSSSEWVVIANDHTFFIPINLQRYLRTLQSSDLVYGGNRLSLKFHDKLLFFASGGAGAVFSRTTVNALLALWSILHRDYCLQLLARQLLARPSSAGAATFCVPRPPAVPRASEGVGDGDRDGDGVGGVALDIDLAARGQDWLGAMRCFMKAFEEPSPSSSAPQGPVQVVESPLFPDSLSLCLPHCLM